MLPRRVFAGTLLFTGLCLAPAAAAKLVPVARGADGVTLLAACAEAPHRALIADHPVVVPAAPAARLFRYRIDGAPPATGFVEPTADGVVLRFPNRAWLNADFLSVILPGARQRFAFSARPEAVACGGAAPRDDKRDRTRNLQKALAAHGLASGRTDGVFSAETEAAIRAYQAYFGLMVDGIPSAELGEHLTKSRQDAVNIPRLQGLAAQIVHHWRPPAWARGAWALTVPLRLRLDETGAVISADAEVGDGAAARRAAGAAVDAAYAAGSLADSAGLPRDLLVQVTLPVPKVHRHYARILARRLARQRVFRGLPPGAPGGRAGVLRLHIDGPARLTRVEVLEAGALRPARLALMRERLARLPSMPPPPAGGGPNLFIADITLFSRAPYVLPGRVAFPDWPDG